MTRKANLLIVDGDVGFTRSAETILSQSGHHLVVVTSAAPAIDLVRSQRPDLVIVNLSLSDENGLDLLEQLKRACPGTPVALTGRSFDVDTAIAAMRRGAYDILPKPVAESDLLALAERAARITQMGSQRRRAAEELQSERVKNIELRRTLRDQYAFGSILGKSAKMKQIHDLLKDVTTTDSTVLIMGESGTGKGLIARILHYNSQRAEGSFVEANCAVYSEGILHSELFGHEKGAFTGAIKQKKGRFELADGGTVFLDEIGDLTPATQLMLLRFLQERVFERVGGEESIRVDVRVIAATNKNLQEGMEKGSFRNDLFYRLNVIPINIPPLRERVEDIPILGMEFLENIVRKTGKKVRGFTDEAFEAMSQYSWPGNVRELENVVERIVVLAKGESINLNDLPPNIMNPSGPASDARLSLSEHERLYILKTLAECDWNKKLAASLLGINRSSLYSKLKKHEIGRSASMN